MSPVLVTGGSGYLGTQLIAALLRDGRQVRATVRSLPSESGEFFEVRLNSTHAQHLSPAPRRAKSGVRWPACAHQNHGAPRSDAHQHRVCYASPQSEAAHE